MTKEQRKAIESYIEAEERYLSDKETTTIESLNVLRVLCVIVAILVFGGAILVPDPSDAGILSAFLLFVVSAIFGSSKRSIESRATIRAAAASLRNTAQHTKQAPQPIAK